MASITIDLSGPYTGWNGHSTVSGCYHKGPTMFASGSVTFTRNSERDKNVYFSGSVTSTRPGGSYGYSVTVAVEIGGSAPYENDSGIPGGRGTRDFSGVIAGETGTCEVVLYCNGGGHHNCNSDVGNYSRVVIGSFDLSALPYNPEVPPTNISGGRVYNQNNVVNGNDKPDWNFYIDWWGESAGTHSITKVNLDLYKSTNLNSIAVTVDNVKKWTRYNFESLLPKCKPGETYEFYTNVLIDNSYWLRKSSYRKHKII